MPGRASEEGNVNSTAGVMRLRRPRWKDPRLIVGIVLVLASVLMGALLVTRLSQTTSVVVSRDGIVPGQVIDASALTTVEVRLGEQEGMYAASAESIPDGAVATQTIRAGEMVPIGAIGQSSDVPLRPVVIPVDTSVAESVTPGATVELWHTSDPDDGASQAELLVGEAVVRQVDEGSSLGMRSVSVEVLVPRDQLAGVLEVLSRGDRLDVIGVPGAYGVAP